ncbi:hypothetical protein QJS04_geneDACA020742 [Acorus gramineus]|uniref:Uncharacterized protein n=1 Tax=Acorus gramineus TaxID=55184 RepID=A0AAV9A1I9_ACOGR|nr:hypothetical protein QJS04_geneDACA020742 [Acorus gramineus]
MFSGVDGARDDESVENMGSLCGDDRGLWIPDVDEQCKPVLGMFFDSQKAAEKFYVNYGKILGFCIRKSSTKYRNVDGAK